MLTTRVATPTIKPLPHRRLIGNGISGGIYGTNNVTTQRNNMVRGFLSVRAVINTSVTSVEKQENNKYDKTKSNETLLDSFVQVRAIVKIKKKIKEGLIDKVENQWFNLIISGGHGISLKLISEDIDPVTNSGKTVDAFVRDWPANSTASSEHLNVDEYTADFTVPSDFGYPGAILITNRLSKEFHLVEIVLQGFQDGPVIFPANSWIHSRNDNSESRIIFRNHTYLPSQTPPGIKILRRDDLLSIRGDGKGERKVHDRIYDYAPYNDLGNPDKDIDLARPILSGPEFPHPRRCRTGRPSMKTDPNCESRVEKPNPIYVPRDESFNETKMAALSAGNLKAVLRNLVPLIAERMSGSDMSFGRFSDIDNLYIDGLTLQDEDSSDKDLLKQVLGIKDKFLKFDIPAVIERNRFSWLGDTEFGRQALAGFNPMNIELLKELPIVSKLDPSVYGPPGSAITKEVLEGEMNGMTVEEAIKNKKLFIIDHHDLYMPFVNKINDLPGTKVYASRTVLFCDRAGALRPIVFEHSVPPTQNSLAFKRAYTHGHDATSDWIWKLSKSHFCAADAGVHMLVNHWLRTHACTEPYIIATHRRLSQMHPIYKLLHPHMRYTMASNTVARQSFKNAGGFIEGCYSSSKYTMHMTSAAYKSMWRFDKEALPADLLRRGMAEEDPTEPSGVKLVIEDYPYAADGLLVWSAIKEWVESYVAHFYPDLTTITEDVELQEWWYEIKNEGHADKKHEPWWPELNSKDNLTNILTTIIWIGSGQHAAMNFGQYPFGSSVLNSPSIMRKLIPQENEPEYEEFLMNPEATFLSSMPSVLQTTKVMAVNNTVSTHSPEEEYLGQEYNLYSHWNDERVKSMFEKFSSRLREIEEMIQQRNKNTKLTNRSGAGVPAYELLVPTPGPSLIGRGIPNSITT